MNPVVKTYWIAKGVGWDNLARRCLQACRMRSGFLRRSLDPVNFSEDTFRSQVTATADDVRRMLRDRFSHFIGAASKLADRDVDAQRLDEFLITPCRKALDGEQLYFGRWYAQTGWPPDFNRDPVHDYRYDSDRHSMDVAKSGPPGDDVKIVWEPSRFSSAFRFARAFAYTNDEQWARAFWAMFDAWIEQNPPMKTAAWGCGQEATFRMMAILFAASVTVSGAEADDRRMTELARLVWRTGLLIDKNINYALSQKNNHGVSESVGLFTAGYVLDGMFGGAKDWKNAGEKYLKQEVARQIYDDGSFVQHSMNYHRVLLDDLSWFFSLKKAEGKESDIDPVIRRRFRLTANWLVEFTDLQSGRCPNYGANDGAQILPLACCDYLDYRPVVQAVCRFTGTKTPFGPGPWDEKSFWLFGGDPPSTKPVDASRSPMFEAPNGGYYILRGNSTWAMTRCHSYRDRPGEPDMLHFDLWMDGENVVRDGGTFHYYTTDPVAGLLKHTAGQNTVEIDGEDQMLRGPRFLWFYWTKSKRLRWESTGPDQAVFEGEHDGYRRLPGRPVHRRSIERNGDRWKVLDVIRTEMPSHHRIVSRFRLAPGSWKREENETDVRWFRSDGFTFRWQKTPGMDCRMFEGQTSPPEGWESLYYGEKTPCPTIVISGDVDFRNEPLTLEYEFCREF